MPIFLRKVVRIFRQEGFFSVLKKSWLVLLWNLVRGEAVFVKKEKEKCTIPPQQAGVLVRQGGMEDCVLFAPYLSEYEQTCEKRFACGEIAFIALVNNKVSYIMWCRETSSLGFSFVGQDTIPVPKNSLYIYDCFTLPEYRRLGIYPFMLDYVVHLYSGVKCYVACQCHTERSMKGIVKAGFRLCWKFYWFKYGPVSIKWKRSYLNKESKRLLT